MPVDHLQPSYVAWHEAYNPYLFIVGEHSSHVQLQVPMYVVPQIAAKTAYLTASPGLSETYAEPVVITRPSLNITVTLGSGSI